MSNVIANHTSRDRLLDRPHIGFRQALGLIKAVATRHKHRRELNHLMALPDYLLKDVGLTRDDVHRELIELLPRQ